MKKAIESQIVRSIVFSVILVMGVLWLAGCGASKGASTNGQCGAGSAYSTTYGGCYSYSGCQGMPGYVWVPSINQCVPSNGTGVGGWPYPTTTIYRWVGQFQITDRSNYMDFLRSAGICDQGQWNWHSGDCDNWTSQAMVVVDAMGTTLPAQAVVTIYPYYNGYSSQIPFYDYLRVTNNNTTLTLQRNGFYKGYNKVFQAVANISALVTNNQVISQYQISINWNTSTAVAPMGTAYMTYQPYY